MNLSIKEARQASKAHCIQHDGLAQGHDLCLMSWCVGHNFYIYAVFEHLCLKSAKFDLLSYVLKTVHMVKFVLCSSFDKEFSYLLA